jgi:hypothetical protein
MKIQCQSREVKEEKREREQTEENKKVKDLMNKIRTERRT